MVAITMGYGVFKMEDVLASEVIINRGDRYIYFRAM